MKQLRLYQFTPIELACLLALNLFVSLDLFSQKATNSSDTVTLIRFDRQGHLISKIPEVISRKYFQFKLDVPKSDTAIILGAFEKYIEVYNEIKKSRLDIQSVTKDSILGQYKNQILEAREKYKPILKYQTGITKAVDEIEKDTIIFLRPATYVIAFDKFISSDHKLIIDTSDASGGLLILDLDRDGNFKWKGKEKPANDSILKLHIKNYELHKTYDFLFEMKKNYAALSVDDITEENWKNTLAEISKIKAKKKNTNESNALTAEEYAGVRSKVRNFLAFRDWLILSMFFNDGAPNINPFESTALDKDREDARKNAEYITELKDTIEQTKSILKLIEDNFKGIINTPSNVNYETLLDKHTKLLIELAKQNKMLAKAQKNKAGLEERIAAFGVDAADGYAISDELLYKGILPNSCFYLRNHDALQAYSLTNENVIREYNERQQIKILVHNVDSKTVIKGIFTAENIKTDEDMLQRQIINSKNVQADAPELKIEEFIKLAKDIPFLIEQAKKYQMENELFKEDKTPKFQTIELPQSYKYVSPPANISYTITTKYNGKDSLLAPFPFEYRVDKLYRIRMKAGVIYSFLQKKSYTIDETANSVTSSSSANYGIDASFGIQLFPFGGGVDVRQSKPFCMDKYNRNGWNSIHFYFGTALKEKPFQNCLLGVGTEFYGGLAIMGGMHLGQTQQLEFKNQQFKINDRAFTYGPFVSIALDLNVFSQLFNLEPIKNPFK